MDDALLKRLALKAKLIDPDLSSGRGEMVTDYGDARDRVRAFVELVIQREREECAVAMEMLGWTEQAKVLRARSNPQIGVGHG